MDKTTISTEIAVVGGGVSGLYAAQLLHKKHKKDVLVLEADTIVGGRVRTLHAGEFAPIDIDLGAHFIHGAENNILVEIGKQQKWNIENLGGWPDYWVIPTVTGKLVLDNNDERFPVMRKIRDHLLLSDEFKSTAMTGLRKKDISMADWLRTHKIPEWAIRLADASIANDYGGCIEKVGVNAAAWENHHWCHGIDYLAFKDAPFTTIVDYLKQDLNIRTSTQVLSVDYTHPEYTSLTCLDLATKQRYTVNAKSVVISVAVPILRNEHIKFQPELPAFKRQAINRLGFGNAVKVLLQFSKRFWPVDCYDIVCGEEGAFIPEYWFEEFIDNSTKKKMYLVTGFAAGRHADDVSKFNESDAIKKSLTHLDKLFLKQTAIRSATPSSDYFVKGMVWNWGKQPFIQGGYSYPALNTSGCNIEDIRTYSMPVKGRIYFCGEATNEKLNPTVNGAMTTSERVVEEILTCSGCATAKL
eukprot:TRINITY_DN7714_c0_g6_i1.p1 TRINITY_DN7714_c0_g6~~TRINITY_DN7714_c0_g6_i1.p1  ORF type:complete len:470 (-),score=86.40 TRINITY_DN7714_c0_g6_i1:129-1538(-)